MDIKSRIRDVPDFPKKGILFRDITPLLKDPQGFKEVIEQLSRPHLPAPPDYVAGIESRGFIFGAAMALRLGCGFVPIRKPGKLPAATIRASYALEYGTDSIEIHKDAIEPGRSVVLVDDLLATGGTMEAAARLVTELGGSIKELLFVVELSFLAGRRKLGNLPVRSLVSY
jgi:adenine phosphoribosyltransferase